MTCQISHQAFCALSFEQRAKLKQYKRIKFLTAFSLGFGLDRDKLDLSFRNEPGPPKLPDILFVSYDVFGRNFCIGSLSLAKMGMWEAVHVN